MEPRGSVPPSMPMFEFSRDQIRPVLEETKLIQSPSQHEVRPRSDLRLARINRPRPTAAIRRRKWIIISAIFAAGIATGFVAGAANVDASPVSHSAMGAAISSTVAAHSTTHATTFPEANRAAKGNRLRVHQVGTAEQATKDWDGRYVQSRAPHEDERKPVAHYMAPRLCFA
jgi:hypothetical protein